MTQALTVMPELTPAIVKRYLCPKATDTEIFMFIRLCESQSLNPFIRDAYLIKYRDDQPATMVVGKDAFNKRAEEHPDFDGFRAGIIVSDGNGPSVEREGTFYTDSERLVGGWAEVYHKGRRVPYRVTVRLSEYDAQQGNWKRMPATMIRKVALVQALREAFPTAFRGLYDAAEMGVDPEALPTNVIDVQAESPRRGPAPARSAVVDSTATATEAPTQVQVQVSNITTEQGQEIALLVHVLGWSPANVAAKVAELYDHHGKVAELPREQVADFLDYLRTQAARQQQREQREQQDAEGSARATAGTA